MNGPHALRDGAGQLLERNYSRSQLKLELDDQLHDLDRNTFDIKRIDDHKLVSEHLANISAMSKEKLFFK